MRATGQTIAPNRMARSDEQTFVDLVALSSLTTRGVKEIVAYEDRKDGQPRL